MSDEGRLAAEVRKGGAARELLENPLMAEALADIEQEIVKEWMNSPSRDAEGREKCFLALKMLFKFKGVLESHIQTGRLANMELRSPTVRERIFGRSV